MKKRIISALLVALMLVTLFPFGAFALGDTITIDKQPKSVEVYAGQDATFTIEASTTARMDLRYFWYDPDKVTLSFSELKSILTDAEKREEMALGTDKTLTLEAVDTNMDGKSIACIVWYADSSSLSSLFSAFDFKVSSTAKLSVILKDPCEVHTLKHHEANASTCCNKGNFEYWQCSVCYRIYLDESARIEGTKKDVTLDVDPNGHRMTYHAQVEPTCEKDGTKEYWQCDYCNKKYGNPEGTGNTLTLAELEIDNNNAPHKLHLVPAKAATCLEKGNIEYYECEVCGDFFNSAGTYEYDKDSSSNGVYIDTLPHTEKWVYDANTHWTICSVCETKIGKAGVHTPSVSEATCVAKAVCECGAEYGEVNPDNHVNTERRGFKPSTTEEPGYTGDIWCLDCGIMVEEGHESDQLCDHNLVHFDAVEAGCEACEGGGDGNIEYWRCTKCECFYTDELAEHEVSEDAVILKAHLHYNTVFGNAVANVVVQEYAYDSQFHWRICKYCGYVFPNSSNDHITVSKTATCCTGANYCAVCQYDNGVLDPNNHVGGTRLDNVREPEGKNPGYTGDVVCIGCGKVLETGWEYFAPCGECAEMLIPVDEVDKTCTKDGVKAHFKCVICGNLYLTEEDAAAGKTADRNDVIIRCTGHDLHPGTDFLTAVNLAELLKAGGWKLQDLADIVTNGDFNKLRNLNYEDILGKLTLKEIDHCYDDECHWLGCQRCGKTLSEINSDLEEQGIEINDIWFTIRLKELSVRSAHTGGIATCKDKAICDECGEAYGEIGTHRYDMEIVPATCTTAGYTEYTCIACDDSYIEDEIPALGHSYDKGVCTRCKARGNNPFWDVSNKDQFYTPVLWAYYYQPQITAGKDESHFNPYGDCNRGQVVTFLWRAAGCPDPVNAENKFSDVVNAGPYKPYYTAILWAAEQGITTGYNDGTFRPGKTVTRAEFVTFLWRYFGKPASTGNIYSFSDYSSIAAPYQDAVAWAVDTGITAGYQDNTFRPNVTCSRWQVVMFMYRAIGEAKAFA